MIRSRRALLGTVIAAAAITALGTAPAQAAGGGKGPDRAVTTSADAANSPDRNARPKVTVSPAAEAAMATIQQRIARYVAKNGTTYSFASYVDSTTGRLVLNTDAPSGLVASLTDLAGAPAAQQAAVSRLLVRKATTSDAWHRRDDIPSYWGGAGLTAGGFLCSSGYAVQNAAGTRFSTTAGHCWANGTSVAVESGLRTYGVVSNRRLPVSTGHPMDFELLGGQSYWGNVYTGGVTSTSSLPVIAAGTAFVGYNDYCHSGRTTGEHCGHTANSISAQVCTSSGCKSPVIAFTGGTMIAGGDSGGAFFAKTSTNIWIRGNVIAGDGVTGFASPWTVLSAELGVNIVTG
jgi:hypothetical protein